MKKLMICLFLTIASSVLAQGPGSAGVVFLLIQPSPRAIGMGGGSVASIKTDAIGIAFNPARLGVAALDKYFVGEFYPNKTAWLPQLAPDIRYNARTVLFGYNFKRLEKGMPISFGIGYTRIFIDLGEQIITGENDPTPLGRFRSTERANVWTFGVGVDHLVKAGIGLSLKDIESNLAPPVAGAEQSGGQASATAHDWGLVVHLPIDEAISKLGKISFEPYPGVRPSLGLGFGYSKSNIGDKITYIDASQADPLPRIARVGFSLNAGLLLVSAKQIWHIFSYEHLNEAEQLLVRTGSGSVTYAKLLGDIDIWNHVIRGKSGATIITKRGWELRLFEIFSYQQGRHEDALGKVYYDTEGIGLGLSGVLKAIWHLSPQSENSGVIAFLTNHLDIQYHSSNLNAGEGHPLGKTKFRGISVRFF
ncbi:hypothetical protein L0337_11840 [candidate division KSB1 bacterium]|nr:hypothetical protein [candidate division KSB1 bacterium]